MKTVRKPVQELQPGDRIVVDGVAYPVVAVTRMLTDHRDFRDPARSQSRDFVTVFYLLNDPEARPKSGQIP